MSRAKRLIFFILGFLLFWTVLLGYFLPPLLFGVPTITYISRHLQNLKPPPSVSTNSIANPAREISGTFIIRSNELGLDYVTDDFICTVDDVHTKYLLTKYFSTDRFSSNRYFEDEIESAKYDIHPEYVSVRFPRAIKETYDRKENTWNIFLCDYFLPESSLAFDKEVKDIKLGTFKQNPTKESFNQLIWFLMRTPLSPTSYIFRYISIHSTQVVETETEIVRIDKGVYTQQEIHESYSNNVRSEYRLNKNDGSVYYSAFINR